MNRFLLPIVVIIAGSPAEYAAGQEAPRAELTRLQCGALYRDDFSSGSPSEAPWRVWPSPEGPFSFVRFEEGEFRASAAGIVWGRTTDGDCVVAADVAHQPGTALYSCQQVHLCAGAGGSADYSVQAYLTTDGQRIYCVSEYHTEPGTEGVTWGYVRDPSDPQEGASWPDDGKLRTVLVERNAETQRGTVYARPDQEWVRCGRPRRFPYGGLGVELKTYSSELTQPALARWDNYRIYPRPGSHGVCVHVVSTDGQPLEEPDTRVQLLDREGQLLVAEAPLFRGRCVLSLRDAPWIGYPVSGRLRLVRGGEICAQGIIEAEGVEGLYPADVWEMRVPWPPPQTVPLPTAQPSQRPQPRAFQNPEDFPPVDLSFLQGRELPTFSQVVEVTPPKTPQEHGVFLADDFESGALDEGIWQTETGSVSVEAGKLRLGEGIVIASLGDHTDLVVVAEVRLSDATSMASVLLLGGPLGPAYRFGVQLRGDGNVVSEYLTGTESSPMPAETLAVPPGPDGVFAVKLERVDDTGKARCFVKGKEGWLPVGPWRNLPMHDLKLVLETPQGTAAFDNVRAYPRPQVKYATFRVGAQLSEEERAQYEGDPLHREIVVELYDAAGNRLAGQARGYHGQTHVPLDPNLWDTYPAAATARVFYLDQPVGDPIPLAAEGVTGLYPGSEWRVIIR